MLNQDAGIGRAFQSLGYFGLLCCCLFLSSTADAAYLLLANTSNNNILRYDTLTSEYLGVFATGKSAFPVDLEFGPNGMLYVLSDAVYRYDGRTGAYIDQIVDSSTSPTNGARAITFDTAGNLYLANTGNNNILRYNAVTGEYLGVFATGKSTLPVDLKFGVDGMLYVLSDAVYRYDGRTGEYIDQLVDSSTSPINGAQALTFDALGNLYLANTGNNNILHYDTTTGDYLGVFATGRSALPVDLQFGPDGMLYVLSDAVYRYDGLTGAYIDQIVDSSTSPISGAQAITFSPQSVPAPSSLTCLVGVGLMVFGMEWWKKRRRPQGTVTV